MKNNMIIKEKLVIKIKGSLDLGLSLNILHRRRLTTKEL